MLKADNTTAIESCRKDMHDIVDNLFKHIEDGNDNAARVAALCLNLAAGIVTR